MSAAKRGTVRRPGRALSLLRRGALHSFLTCVAMANAVLLHPGAAHAQAEGAAAAAAALADSVCGAGGVSPLLSESHWAVRAADRTEALGLAPGYFPAGRAAERGDVCRALAAADSAARSPAERSFANAALRRYAEELGGWGAFQGRIGVAYLAESGRLAPSRGFGAARTEPAALAGLRQADLRLAAVLTPHRSATLFLDLAAGTGGLEAVQWEASATALGLVFSAGRAPLGYGWARSGGVTLSPRSPLPRVEIRTARAASAGGILGPLGRVTAHTFLTRLDEARHPTRPWLWGARLAARPADRLTIGVNRASIFAGDSARVTVRTLTGMFVGVLSNDFENQIVSADARYRLPTERALPITLYGEWGADDGAGALGEQPAWVVGAMAPAVRGIAGLSLGAEASRFAACCGHGAWYTHSRFTGNWVSRDRPLGHPLGGEGNELALLAGLTVPDRGFSLETRVWRRVRSAASLDRGTGGGNLYARSRTGASVGGEAEATVHLRGRRQVRIVWTQDVGSTWSEYSLHAEIFQSY